MLFKLLFTFLHFIWNRFRIGTRRIKWDVKLTTRPRSGQILCSECSSDCKSLASISFEIGSELVRIESRAVSSSSLKSITIHRPSSYRFSNCDSLSSISLKMDSCESNQIHLLLWLCQIKHNSSSSSGDQNVQLFDDDDWGYVVSVIIRSKLTKSCSRLHAEMSIKLSFFWSHFHACASFWIGARIRIRRPIPSRKIADQFRHNMTSGWTLPCRRMNRNGHQPRSARVTAEEDRQEVGESILVNRSESSYGELLHLSVR
jgi:hypothetical protein